MNEHEYGGIIVYIKIEKLRFYVFFESIYGRDRHYERLVHWIYSLFLTDNNTAHISQGGTQ
jgi:hypothetical protein